MPPLSQSSQQTKSKVVAAIPCFNTRPFIADLVAKAKKRVDQVIVIDDGSSDGTAEAAKAAGALVTRHETNRGYGKAIRSCFEAAKANDADVLVILDGDNQHNPDEIPLLLDPIFKGEADFVIGSRFLTDEAYMPGYRKLGISVITLLFNLGSRTKVSDAQSGFRAYDKKVFQGLSLAERGMSISIETLVKARKLGFRIKEVPIHCLYASFRFNMNAIKHGLRIALAVPRLRFKNLL